MKRIFRLIFVVSLLLVAVDALMAGSSLAQDAPPVTYERYDVGFDVEPDGTFTVRETQQIRFDGEFSQAFADIPLAYTTRIDDVRVYEGDTPYELGDAGPRTYTTDYTNDTIDVTWNFDRTKPGDVRTFTLAYTVVGGLWIYPDGDLLEWRAVPADRSGVPVEASRVTVTLPPDPITGQPVPAGELRTASFGQPATAQTADGQAVFESAGPIPDGAQLQVQVGFPHGIVSVEPQPWQMAEDTADLRYRYKSMDYGFTINADGTVDVAERHDMAVEAGALRQGVQTITHTGMDDVVDVAVQEGGQVFTQTEELCNYCYSVSQTPRSPGWISYDARYDTVTTDDSRAGSTQVVYTVPALVKGEEAAFDLRYKLLGALAVEDHAQTFNWTIILDEQDVPVESASVRIDLPPGVEPADVQVTGGTLAAQPNGTLRLQPAGAIQSNVPWDFSITLPAKATAAVKPQWQQDKEAAVAVAQQAQARQARLRLLFGGLALLVLTGGLLSLLLIWYRWGRDDPAPLPAEYIPEPPSDLPPGIVAYLLDEKPSTKGALAALFHLAALGLLRIKLTPEIRVQRNWLQKLQAGQSVQTPDGRTVAIPGHLVTLFNDLSPAIPTDSSKKLDQIAGQFQASLPDVYEQMGREVGPLFDTLPDKARGRWRALGRSILLLGFLALFFGCIGSTAFGGIALAPGLALVLVGLAWTLASRWMPQRSPTGAAEAAKWRAFRRYLLNLEDYGNQIEAQEILDRYFAYAVAMDVEEVVLRDAERLDAHFPVWTAPIDMSFLDAVPSDSGSGSSSSSTLTWKPAPAKETGDSPAPTPAGSGSGSLSLSGASRQIGMNLSLASLSLSRTLSVAAGSGGSTMDAMGKALRSSAAGGSSATRYSSSSSRSSWSSSSSSSRSSSFSRSSSSSSSHSRSSSRSSGGGGSRGFR